MKIERKWFPAAMFLLLPLLFVFNVKAENDETTFRWDLISVDASVDLRAGGQDSAGAADNSVLTLTGSGTFRPGDPDNVTGGGTWSLGTSSGTYQVTRLVRFTLAPCTVPTCVSGFGGTDLILPEKEARAGLVVLKIRYSDGHEGVLTVSCGLNGTPASVFEGIIASKDFVEYWNQAFNGANSATIFHVIHQGGN